MSTSPSQITLTAHPSLAGDLAFIRLHINVSGSEPLTPDALKSIFYPMFVGEQNAFVFSGDAPEWVIAYLTPVFSSGEWVGVYDPNFGGIFVVWINNEGLPLGESLPLSVGQVIGFELNGDANPNDR